MSVLVLDAGNSIIKAKIARREGGETQELPVGNTGSFHGTVRVYLCWCPSQRPEISV